MEAPQGKLSRRKIPSWVVKTVIYTVSLASLVWVSYGVNFGQILRDMASLDWRYVTLAVILDLSVYLCHGWRWTILLTPVKRVSFWRSVQAIYIGLFVNEVLPLRTGELIRCYLMAHWNDIPISISLSSAAVERLLDGIWMICAFLITTSLVKLPNYLVDAGRLLGFILVIASAGLIFISLRKHHAHSVISKHRWAETLEHIIDGLHAMGNRRTLTAAFGASLLYLVLQIVPVWALMQAYGLDLSIWAASAVLIIVRLGTMVPNAPGNAGVYQVMCVLSLGLFGIDKTTAVGFSWTMFGVLTFPLLVGGFVALMLTGLKLHEIRHRARTNFPSRTAPASEN